MGEAVNRMSQNVRTKAVRRTIFLSSQDKIRRDKRMPWRKKRLITSHKRADVRDGRRSRAKGSHRRDGRSRRFQTVVGSTSHAPACLNALITSENSACQRRAISLECRANFVISGGYLDGGGHGSRARSRWYTHARDQDTAISIPPSPASIIHLL
jgi:hypothetical protein